MILVYGARSKLVLLLLHIIDEARSQFDFLICIWMIGRDVLVADKTADFLWQIGVVLITP